MFKPQEANPEIKELCVQHEITEVYFYTYTSVLVNNIFTACIILNKKGELISRGISICSLTNSYSALVGKNKAFGRAIRAIVRQQSFEPIMPQGRYKNRFSFRSIKTSKLSKEQLNEIIKELYNIGEFKYKDGITPTTTHLTFNIPLSYPITETAGFFKFKSHFKPDILMFEKNWLEKKDTRRKSRKTNKEEHTLEKY